MRQAVLSLRDAREVRASAGLVSDPNVFLPSVPGVSRHGQRKEVRGLKGTNDELHEARGHVPERKMGPGYYPTPEPAGIAEHPKIDPLPWIGIGGAPTRATTLPADAAGRKQYPMASGLLDYFPDALAAVAHLSWKGNEQHNPGQALHWAREKSTDEADTLIRHFVQRGSLDTDGIRHSAKVCWRALALLQKEIEAEQR